MKCTVCGHEVLKHQRYCSECGEPNPYHLEPASHKWGDAEPGFSASERSSSEPLSFGWGVLSILFPIVGIVLYFSWRNTKPRAARTALWCGLIAFVIAFLLRISAR